MIHGVSKGKVGEKKTLVSKNKDMVKKMATTF